MLNRRGFFATLLGAVAARYAPKPAQQALPATIYFAPYAANRIALHGWTSAVLKSGDELFLTSGGAAYVVRIP
jgi:hypothetical protein